MSPHDVGENETFDPYLPEPEATSPDLFVSVPPSLPPLNPSREPTGLNRSRFGVGLEGPRYEMNPTGNVQAAWVILGLAAAMALPGVVMVWATGDWMLVVIVAPFAGLFLAGILRTIYGEHVAKQKKIERMDRRLRDMKR